MLSFLGTKITSTILGALNPTLHVQAGNISALPWINLGPDQTKRRIAEVAEMISIARRDWDQLEQSWDFENPPILRDGVSDSLNSRYDGLRRDWVDAVDSLSELEKQNNAFWIEHFGVGEELSADVPRDEITLECNPHFRYGSDKSDSELEALLLADTMREFISYAVGCMLGRYSLDQPGLILANQGETADDYRRIVGEYLVMSNEKEGEDGSEQLSGSDRLAEGDGRGGDDLSGDQTVSEGGDLRAEGSDSQSSSVHSVKHSGRPGAEIDGGLQTIPPDSSGIESGSGNSTSDRPTSELHNSGTTAADSGSAGRDQQDEQFIEKQAPVANSLLDTQYSFLPDEDNVIPLLDGDWFEDDITERFKAFLKVTFGTEHYEENLTFLENSLFPANSEGKKRKTIRDYFLKEFYNHHIKLYKKRPIYWLFSSPKGTFNALIYMHRYRPDLVSTVLQYLRDFRDKLAHRQDHQQMVADSAASSKSEQSKALKEIATLKKQITELEDYERDTLFPLAQQKIDIDLDDGVKHNYALFGKALKKVTGLSAK